MEPREIAEIAERLLRDSDPQASGFLECDVLAALRLASVAVTFDEALLHVMQAAYRHGCNTLFLDG